MSSSFVQICLTSKRRDFAFCVLNLLFLLPLHKILPIGWIHEVVILAVLILVCVCIVKDRGKVPARPNPGGAVAMLPVWMFIDLLILLSAVIKTGWQYFDDTYTERFISAICLCFRGAGIGALLLAFVLMIYGSRGRYVARMFGKIILFWSPFVGGLNSGLISFSTGASLRALLLLPLIWLLLCYISEQVLDREMMFHRELFSKRESLCKRNRWFSFALAVVFWNVYLCMPETAMEFSGVLTCWIHSLTDSAYMVALYGIMLLILAARCHNFDKKSPFNSDGLFLTLLICVFLLKNASTSVGMIWLFQDVSADMAAQLALLSLAGIAFYHELDGWYKTLGVSNRVFLALNTILLCGILWTLAYGCFKSMALFALFIVSLFFLYRERSQSEIEENPTGGKRTANWILSMALITFATVMFCVEYGAPDPALGILLSGLAVSVGALLILSWPHPHNHRVTVRTKSLILIGLCIVCVLAASHLIFNDSNVLGGLWRPL